ncbi:MAG: ABC transporter ATP-binding protein [Pseudomonadales bacterium]
MNAEQKMWLEIQQATVCYGAQAVLRDVSLSLVAGEIGCLLGGSGTGKSTLLRAVAGFEPLASGSIVLAGRQLSGTGINVPAHQRGVGMVFQDHALFPHLNVADNIAFGLHALSKTQREQRVEELLAMIALSDCARRFPHELSGGQQQRIALARALAPQPSLVLLDEPFASLDTELRQRLAMDVRALLKRSKTAALLVTHDQQEAFAMADRVGLLADGALQQWATPYALYHEPVNRTVADFVGEGVFLPAALLSERCLQLSLGEFCRLHDLPIASCGKLDVLVRPDDVMHDDASPVQARVLAKQFRGADFLYTLQLKDGAEVLSLVPSHHDHAIGEAIGIRVELDHLIAFPAR